MGATARSAYVYVEVGQSARGDLVAARGPDTRPTGSPAGFVLDVPLVRNVQRDALRESGTHGLLPVVLSRWAAADPTRIVLLPREIRETVIECRLLRGWLDRTLRARRITADTRLHGALRPPPPATWSPLTALPTARGTGGHSVARRPPPGRPSRCRGCRVHRYPAHTVFRSSA